MAEVGCRALRTDFGYEERCAPKPRRLVSAAVWPYRMLRTQVR